MIQKKILNDPVYGFISIPSGTVFELIEHPIFQRLRRIKQLGLTHYVYPGALNTRFHHAIGAMHLMREALNVLRSKGIEITDEEYEASLIAILLHDIGHGPYSHALEHQLLKIHHEEISSLLMDHLNEEMNGRLSLAIQIFKGAYNKPFLYQLVSSQLDVDRMDYLKRDSFFTGVAEGVIGHDRILKMLSVHEGNIVVEEKGIYSVEKYLMARRLMYWQVYLHKTVLAAEKMLERIIQRTRERVSIGHRFLISDHLAYFFNHDVDRSFLTEHKEEVISHFSKIDDVDVVMLLKSASESPDQILNYLADGLLNRRLYRCDLTDEPPHPNLITRHRHLLMDEFDISETEAEKMLIYGMEETEEYSEDKLEIQILTKAEKVVPLSQFLPRSIVLNQVEKYFFCRPKF